MKSLTIAAFLLIPYVLWLQISFAQIKSVATAHKEFSSEPASLIQNPANLTRLRIRTVAGSEVLQAHAKSDFNNRIAAARFRQSGGSTYKSSSKASSAASRPVAANLKSAASDSEIGRASCRE